MKLKIIIIVLLIAGIVISYNILVAGSTGKSSSPSESLDINPADVPPALTEPAFTKPALTSFSAISTPGAPTQVLNASTGAILVAPPSTDIQASQELFALLALGTIKEATFMIQPLPQDRKIVITVRPPIDTNMDNVQAWLLSHGYSHIPMKNFKYFENNF